MVELIASIIFLISFFAVIFMLYIKMPVLADLPKDGDTGFKKGKFLLQIEKKVKDFHFDFFKKQVFLHKLLSYTKIGILKIERKIDILLHGIRKNAKELQSNQVPEIKEITVEPNIELPKTPELITPEVIVKKTRVRAQKASTLKTVTPRSRKKKEVVEQI